MILTHRYLIDNAQRMIDATDVTPDMEYLSYIAPSWATEQMSGITLGLGLPMVVSLNLSDIARKRGSRVEAAKLAELLGVPVVETVATSHSGTEAIRKAVAMLPRDGAKWVMTTVGPW